MKNSLLLLLNICFATTIIAQKPKLISDCTITFSVESADANDSNNIGSKVVYLKGKDVRVDLISNKFSQTIFYNGKDGNVTVLKTIGQSKYISYFNANEWKKQNEIFDGIAVSLTNNSKIILNYECKEATLKLTNGTLYKVYYLPTYILSVSENPFEFKDIPGIVLEYQSQTKTGKTINYIAQKIDFDPVPSMQFEIPVKGYRLLNQ